MNHPHEQLPLFQVPTEGGTDPREAHFERLMDTGMFNAHQARTMAGLEGIPDESPERPEEDAEVVSIQQTVLPAVTGRRRFEPGDSEFDEWNRHLREPVSDEERAQGQAALNSAGHRRAVGTLALINEQSVGRAAGDDVRRRLALMAARADKRKRGTSA